jgi:hypothetical protein
MYFVAVSNINFLHNAMEILFSYGRNRCRTINGLGEKASFASPPAWVLAQRDRRGIFVFITDGRNA